MLLLSASHGEPAGDTSPFISHYFRRRVFCARPPYCDMNTKWHRETAMGGGGGGFLPFLLCSPVPSLYGERPQKKSKPR